MSLSITMQSLHKLGFLNLLLLIAIPVLSLSQHNTEYTVRHFTNDSELPQNSVKSIIADRDGFIWLTTEDGLVRYDGRGFHVFDNSTLPLRSNRFSEFYPVTGVHDSNYNNFFAVTSEGDYLLVKNGSPVTVEGNAYENFLSGLPFRQALKKDSIYLLVQTLPDWLKESWRTSTFIIPDGAGGSFLCAPRSVSYYKGLEKKYTLSFPTSGFRSYFQIGHRLFWLNDEGQFGKIDADRISNLVLSGDILHHNAYRKKKFDIYWSSADGRAFIYLDKNLYTLKEDNRRNLVSKLILSGFDCKINSIVCVFYEENSRSIFLGSVNKGLFIFTPQQFKTLSLGDNSEDNVYYALLPWGNDKILTPQGHVLGLNSSGELPLMKKVGHLDRYSMLIDRKGNIWTKDGFYCNKFDKEGKKLLARWYIGDLVTQLYEGKDGRIWIGSRQKGLYNIDLSADSGAPQLFPMKKLISGISSLQEDKKGYMWIGTDAGLYKMNLQNGAIDIIKGLEQSYIRCLYIPNAEETWITTYGNGFFLYSGDKLVHFPNDRNGYLKTAHCIVEDKRGYYWIPTNKGLFQALKQDLLNYAQGKQQQIFYLYHTREEGFLTNEFNGGCQPCAAKLGNGYIALPSLNGVVTFGPDSLKITLPDNKIFIDGIEIDEKPVSLKDTITVPRGFKLLQFHCSTPYIGNDYNVSIQYAWTKKNEKPVWLTVNDNKTISQSTLEHGVYMLHIRKANGFGSDNYSYRTLMVIVPPAFHETVAFYILLALLSILLIGVYIRLRLRNIRRRNRQLQKLVDEHTAELRSALSALSVSEQNIHRQLHMREILLTSMSHDIGSPLRYITMMAEDLQNDLKKENVPDIMKQNATSIFQSGYYLYHLTRNLLQYLRITGENASPHFEKFDLHQLVEAKINIFRPIAAGRSITLVNEVPEHTYLHNDALLIDVIVHNLLDNAIKAIHEGTVTVNANRTSSQTEFVVSDTGSGMPASIAAYYNDDNFRKDNKKTDSHPGFGLDVVKELVRLIGSKLKIETGAGGTKVHIVFE